VAADNSRDNALIIARACLDNVEKHVFLLAQDKEYTPLVQVKQEGEVHVSPVGGKHIARVHAGAQLRGPCRIMMTSLLDDREAWQHAGRVYSHMGFGGGFLAAVLGPVNTV
jgi:hypothetical protein